MIERNANKIIADSWEELELQIPVNKYDADENIKLKKCPECKDHGKRRDNTFDVSVVPAKGVGRCWKCGSIFVIRKKSERVETYTPPSKANLTKLSAEGLQYFTNRRISQDAVKFFKITEENGYVAFPYFFDGDLVNIKYKRITEKRYRQSPNGKHVVFNYEEARKFNAVIVCEGEEEVMCWYDAGFSYAVSVDSGAPNPNDKIEKKLECITNCFDLFENADIIYLATDNDDNGRRLQQELIRRFDTDKVRIVDFGQYKDGNDYLLYEGVDELKALIKSAREIRMDGVFHAADFKDKLFDMYKNGLPKASTTHMPSVDKVWRWRESEVTTVTGYANEGKSALFNINLPILKAVFDGWKFGLFIPENLPAEQYYEDVIHAYIGKTTDKDHPQHRMSIRELEKGYEFCNKHFFLVNPDEAPTLENLFKRFDYLVRKQGIRGVIIDPFNMVESLFKGNKTYDLYVSEFMTELTKFAQKRKLCVILVAHQNKPERKLPNGNWPEPDAYNIKGGGTFFDKTTNLVSVYRPYRLTDKSNPLTQLSSLKIKMKKYVAETGSVDIYFNWQTNRYEDALLGTKNPLDVKKDEETITDYVDELPF